MAAPAETMDVSSEARRAIDAAVREFVSDLAIRDIEIHAGEDHYGDPALFIEVSHDLSATPVDPRALTNLASRLLEKLPALGEHRLPYVRHHFADKQKVVGFK